MHICTATLLPYCLPKLANEKKILVQQKSFFALPILVLTDGSKTCSLATDLLQHQSMSGTKGCLTCTGFPTAGPSHMFVFDTDQEYTAALQHLVSRFCSVVTLKNYRQTTCKSQKEENTSYHCPGLQNESTTVGCNQILYSTFFHIILGQTLNEGLFAAAAQCTATPQAPAGCYIRKKEATLQGRIMFVFTPVTQLWYLPPVKQQSHPS